MKIDDFLDNSHIIRIWKTFIVDRKPEFFETFNFNCCRFTITPYERYFPIKVSNSLSIELHFRFISGIDNPLVAIKQRLSENSGFQFLIKFQPSIIQKGYYYYKVVGLLNNSVYVNDIVQNKEQPTKIFLKSIIKKYKIKEMSIEDLDNLLYQSLRISEKYICRLLIYSFWGNIWNFRKKYCDD